MSPSDYPFYGTERYGSGERVEWVRLHAESQHRGESFSIGGRDRLITQPCGAGDEAGSMALCGASGWS